jgi:hypothetical protein
VTEEVHTIPVPKGWSVEQAWEVLRRGEKLPDSGEYGWASIVIEDGKLVKVL